MYTLEFLIKFFVYVCDILVYGLVAWAILSWLIAFNVINLHNRAVRAISDGLDRVFNPMLRPIRRIMPDMGGIDLSPMVLILIIMFLAGIVPSLAHDYLLPGLVVG